MSPTFPHESLEVYQRYLSVTGQCEELISQGSNSIVALDHLDRAMESIGDNLLMSLWRIRGMLLGMKRVRTHCVREERTAYGSPCFQFANLDMYRVSLEGAGWIHELLEELSPKARMRKKLDISTTGTVLNIAEGHGRTTPADQNRFMKMAEEHAFQTILMLDLLVSRREVDAARIEGGKTMQGRVISMLHAWCAKNGAT